MVQVFCCHRLNYRWRPLCGYRNSLYLLEHSDTDSEITWSQSTMYLCVLQPENVNIHMCFQQNFPENICMRSLCSFLFQVGQPEPNFIFWKYLVMAFAISGFPLASETSPPSIYFQWWYQRTPRGGEGSSCRHDSPFLGNSAGCECSAASHGTE